MNDWLPELILLDDYDGDWSAYIDDVYKAFHNNFIVSKPNYKGRPVAVRREPRDQGKEAGFWHATSQGQTEWERTPDIRRCERIKWIRRLIECTEKEKVRTWETIRGADRRIIISLPDFSYIVVLAIRKTYTIFVTAFFVEYENRRRKFKREWVAWNESQKG